MVDEYTCPVCGYSHLTEPPRRSPSRGPSYEICPGCGFEFGYTDDDRGYTYESWRAEWVADAMPWRTDFEPPPDDWDPQAQLDRLLSAGQ